MMIKVAFIFQVYTHLRMIVVAFIFFKWFRSNSQILSKILNQVKKDSQSSLIMGITISKIIFPNQDVSDCIMSFLSVDDARELMITSRYIHQLVVTDRDFWLKRAQRLYAIDPAHFRALRNPSEFDQKSLIRKVQEAHIEYCAIKAQ